MNRLHHQSLDLHTVFLFGAKIQILWNEKYVKESKIFLLRSKYCKSRKKIRRGLKLEGCTFVNFGNLSGTEGESSQKREKNGKKQD